MLVALWSSISHSFAFNENPILSDSVNFTGVVRFEQRFTRVQPTQCVNGPCLQSKPYWSIVFDSGQSKYLVDKRLSGEMAPEAVKLNGVTLRPGTRVRVAGEAVSGGPSFFLLLNVQKIKLLKELGWSCRSKDDLGPKLQANVWYQISEDLDATYKLRVEEVRGQNIFQIVYLDHAASLMQDGQIIFGGTHSQETVELKIFQDPEKSLNYSSILKVVKSADSHSGTPFDFSIEMVCNQTRFSAN